MKSLLCLFLLSVFVNTACFAQADGEACDKCPYPRVALYDCDIQVPVPEDANLSEEWYNLFWASAAANDFLMANGFNTDCINKIDQTMIKAADLRAGILRLGPESANRAPSGAIYSSDYLIRSVVELVPYNTESDVLKILKP